MIKELENRFAGFYAPSPGSVYPTLQLLEDRGYVISTTENGKRTYAITDEGRAYLTTHTDAPHGRHRRQPDFGASPEMRAFGREVFEFGRAVIQAARAAGHDPQRMRRLRDVIDKARRDIYSILGEPPTPPPTEL